MRSKFFKKLICGLTIMAMTASVSGFTALAAVPVESVTLNTNNMSMYEEMLLKSIPKNSLLIMENATFHRKAELRELVGNAQCEVLFLPPYSPDLNPIENYA